MVDQVVKLKRNTSNTTAPTTSDIIVGELAISAVDGKIYLRKTDDSIVAQANEDDIIALAIALG
jgi:hypothetical protein